MSAVYLRNPASPIPTLHTFASPRISPSQFLHRPTQQEVRKYRSFHPTPKTMSDPNPKPTSTASEAAKSQSPKPASTDGDQKTKGLNLGDYIKGLLKQAARSHGEDISTRRVLDDNGEVLHSVLAADKARSTGPKSTAGPSSTSPASRVGETAPETTSGTADDKTSEGSHAIPGSSPDGKQGHLPGNRE